MKQALIYSTKVWLTVLLVGPIIFSIVLVSMNNFGEFAFIAYITSVVSIPFEILLGIPSIVLFWQITHYLIPKQYTVAKVKVFLSLTIAIICIPLLVFMNWLLVQFHFNSIMIEQANLLLFPRNLFTFIICNSLLGILCSWIYRLIP